MSEPSNAAQRRLQAQDVLEVLDERGVEVRLEGERALIVRNGHGKMGSTLAWRIKQLEPELAELLRAKAERRGARA